MVDMAYWRCFILFMGAAVSSIIIDISKEYDVPNVIGVSYEDAENTDYDSSDTDDGDDVESSDTAQSSDEWKEFLKDYEKWADKYIELLKKMKKNPDDLSLLTEYSKLLEEFEKWTDESEKYEESLSNSPKALSEYLSTTTRFLNKISEASK